MKTIALLLLSTLSCFAQFRFNNYTLYSTSTNSSVGANAATTNINATVSVAQGNYAQVQIASSVFTNNVNATNMVSTYWDASFDGTRFTNAFTIEFRSATNGESWMHTNFAVTYPFLRLKYLSNANATPLTNVTVKLGQKIGL